jgi:Zn-dependent peptidase ImmA (M78 family)
VGCPLLTSQIPFQISMGRLYSRYQSVEQPWRVMKRVEIETRAKQILRDHNLLSIPVDPLKVASTLGIKVLSAVFSEPNKSGAVVRRDGEFVIFVNSNEPPARKRFTVAHEIGHRLLHMAAGVDEFVDTDENFRTTGVAEDEAWNDDRRREWEANVFASALLMEEEAVRARWRDLKDPVTLAWMFQVSPTAMTVRLTQLGLLQELA